MALPIFAITIFVSAFLLFLVQPLVGKLILPKLGGTPQVWNTCMVFFQSTLLLGYAYTHSVSTRLKLRQQLMVHGALLLVPVALLYFVPMYVTVVGDETHTGWTPPPGANPIVDSLVLLAMIVGIPFFVVSTSAPLLQKWFAYSGHKTAKDPYFLYSVSNLGSMLSLFLYPVLVEPNTYLQDQTNIWFGGYILLVGLVLYCAYTIFQVAPPDDQILATEAAAAAAAATETSMPATPEAAPAPTPAPAADASTAVKSGPAPGSPRGMARKKGMKTPGKADDEALATPSVAAPVVARGATAEMDWMRRIRWILLAAVPSSMMLGVTSYISTDLSPFSYVWIIPLGLYLLSFIVVYERALKWTEQRFKIFGGVSGYTLHQITIFVAQPIGVLILCFVVLTRSFDPTVGVFLVMLGFFANALGCHGELAEDRPATKHLTEYFLLMSVGGAVGGLFNGLIAPVVFQTGILEFYIVIVVACVVRPTYVASGWFDELIVNAFPQFGNWWRNQGDELAKSLGKPTPRSTYLFSLILDVIFGLFVMSFVYWLKTTTWLGSFINFFKISQDWRPFFFRVLIFGIPMVFCFFFAGRPLRMSLAVGGLLLGYMWLGTSDERNQLAIRRTYFGLLKVLQSRQYPIDPEERLDFLANKVGIMKLSNEKTQKAPLAYTYLMHGTTYHGRNYRYDEQDKTMDWSRLATTYYHRYGPVGVVMEQDNWFKGKQNSFNSDARLPAALIGDLMASAGTGFNHVPTALAECWSEPPFATIGLGTGTMASYARPFQCMTYYEIDDVIRSFSLPDDPTEEAHFTFLQNAIRRGVNLEVIMGDARLSLEPRREKNNIENTRRYFADFSKRQDEAIFRSYAKANYQFTKGSAPDREKFYKVINVDAFSSDAIPIHLVTKQAISIYMSKLRDDGVLCVHTSNRHMDLVRPVARIAMELSKESQNNGGPAINCLVGKDDGSADDEDDDRGRRTYFTGHYGSEYVMIFRGDVFKKYVDGLEAKKKEFIDNLKEAQEAAAKRKDGEEAQQTTKLMFSGKGNLPNAPVPFGHAPPGYHILNSIVEWFDPYEDRVITLRNGQRYKVHEKVTSADSLWTDDYSNILSVVRWHVPAWFWWVLGACGIAIVGLIVAIIRNQRTA